jgi:hypothetical protein
MLLAFASGSSYLANAEDAVLFDQSAFSNDAPDASSMTWPLLPGESVLGLARLFYPNDKAMRQQFVAKTLHLNASTQPDLKATTSFDTLTLLVIPTLKSLSINAGGVSKKSNNKSLKMSYGLKQTTEPLPQKLIQAYEELVSRNAFLKEQLAKLNEQITLLQSKLDALKLAYDKTLTLPKAGIPDGDQLAAKKVFKNLNKEINQASSAESVHKQPAEASIWDGWKMSLGKIIVTIAALLLLGALIFIMKKYRERMFDTQHFADTKAQPTVADFSGRFEEKSITHQEESSAVTQQAKAAKEVDTRLGATLEEAKLLISVNRATDAIAHLKATIASQPKASISHWLYLLEVFRKFNMKEDFEQYAERLHQTFNVMTPVWQEKSVEIYIPQSLEEFPHIMEQLYGVWPGELASVYLRSLMTDNRGGDRAGFGKEVLEEVLILITLLDTLKEIPN